MKEILKKYKKSFFLITFILLGCTILSVSHPYIVKMVLDLDFTSSNTITSITVLIISYGVIHILLAVFKNLRNIQVNQMVCNILKEIRNNIFSKVLAFPMKVFDQYQSAEIYTRLTVDVDNMNSFFSDSVPVIVNNSLYILFMIIMLYFANISLGLIGTAIFLVIGVISYQCIKGLKKLDKSILDKRDEENKEYVELFQKNKLTYLFQLQDQNIQNFDMLYDEELKRRKRYIFIENFFYPLILLLQMIGIFIILYYALYMNQNIALGSIYLAIYYIKQCRVPMNEIFNKLQEIQTCFNSFQRIRNIQNVKELEDIKKGKQIDLLKGNIEFQEVSIQYDTKEVLKNISFQIKQGQKVTIVGRTGVGKTSLIAVLMRLYENSYGKILLDGEDQKNISIESVRKNISYISQTPYIFKDTIRNNIQLGDKDITDEDILHLAKQIGAISILDKCKNGLDEQITKARLSKGELQMIAFLRAILHQTNIYIFDEPTSNLDLKTEQMIQNVIDEIAKTSTVIIIAHRKSTIEKSDKIIYLKDGKIDKIDNKVS